MQPLLEGISGAVADVFERFSQIGTSTAFRLFTRSMETVLPDAVRRNIRVSHQARAEDVERVEQSYTAAGIDADVQPFFQDVPRRMSEAQLVISRAGASSVADLTVIGRPAILIPFAAATADHQTANARGLVAAGGAILIPESRLDAQVLAEQMMLVLGNPQGAEDMARAALSCGRPDAAQTLADMVEALAQTAKTQTSKTRKGTE